MVERMEKMKYEAAEAEVIVLHSEDVLLASDDLDEYEGEPVVPGRP